jgi:PncC family amidohydrolase
VIADPDHPTDAELGALGAAVVRACAARGLTLATAESCTGGLVGHLVTETPGASACFAGGIISYSNALKEALLGVPADLLAANGAVSGPVAAAMAEGVRSRAGVDIAIAVTGVAGPDGGTAEKPVGLTFIACATAGATVVHERRWPGDRHTNKRASAGEALAMVLVAADETRARGAY